MHKILIAVLISFLQGFTPDSGMITFQPTKINATENIIKPLTENNFLEMKSPLVLPSFSKKTVAGNETWKLIFVIPLFLTALIVAPVFIATWFLIVFSIFQKLIKFQFPVPYNYNNSELKQMFKLKENIHSIKTEGWTLLSARRLGLSIITYGYAIIFLLVGCMLLIENF